MHVGLVERVDPEDRAGDRGRELPAEELLPELVLVRKPNLLRLAIGAVGRLAGRRHEALPLLSGRLGEQLLGPQPEAGGALLDAHLVAAVAPVLTEREAELEAGITFGEPARIRHLLRAPEEPRDVDAHQRGRHHPERRQRRVAAADPGLTGKRCSEASLPR